MFTGIVEELGTVRAIAPRADGARIEIACSTVLEGARPGDSIAVDGCCLTVVELGEGWWAADAQPESLARTTLGRLVEGAPVNLERPVRLADRLGGHLVQGHVDGVGTIVARTPEGDGSVRFQVALDAGTGRYVVEKGSITLDGVSLTVTDVLDASDTTDGTSDAEADVRIGIAVIPHTLAVTTFGARAVGDGVNVEVDVLAKYVERLLPPRRSS
ncbi:MAG TPA: riboflavin synthase [Acidimicrobiia bacterium]|nr:riboflavin synthase [Acidimicrobiia bacterium]